MRSAAGTGKTDSMAVASLVMGIGGLSLCPVLGSLIGLILGLVAKRRIATDPMRGGSGLATGGIVTGAIGIVLVPVLVAIAIPTFIGARDRVRDRLAETTLSSALQTAVGIANQARTYRAVNDQSLAATNTGFTFVANGESGGPDIVSYMIVDDSEIRMAVRSASGKCLGVRDDSDGAHVGWASHEEGTQCNAGAFQPQEFANRSAVSET